MSADLVIRDGGPFFTHRIPTSRPVCICRPNAWNPTCPAHPPTVLEQRAKSPWPVVVLTFSLIVWGLIMLAAFKGAAIA